MTKRILWILAVAMMVPVAGHAKRDFGIYGIGGRVGMSIDPDQFVFGGHVDLGDVADRLQLQPSLEIGVGDDMKVVTLLADFNYHFREEWKELTPYIGAAMGPVFLSDDFDDDMEIGLTLQGGLKKQLSDGAYSYLGEVRVGLFDTPDFKFLIGFAFGN